MRPPLVEQATFVGIFGLRIIHLGLPVAGRGHRIFEASYILHTNLGSENLIFSPLRVQKKSK